MRAAEQEHAIGSPCNRQHGIQAYFLARYMGVRGLMPFLLFDDVGQLHKWK